MPIIRSAKKALRQNRKRRARNAVYKIKIKDLTKKALLLFKQNKAQELAQILPSLYKTLDKSAKVAIIKKNTAARRKSRFAKKLNLLLSPRSQQGGAGLTSQK